jgi:hypothetical protein
MQQQDGAQRQGKQRDLAAETGEDRAAPEAPESGILQQLVPIEAGVEGAAQCVKNGRSGMAIKCCLMITSVRAGGCGKRYNRSDNQYGRRTWTMQTC